MNQRVFYFLGHKDESAVVVRIAFAPNTLTPLLKEIVAQYTYKDFLQAGARAIAEADVKVRNRIVKQSNLYNEEIP